MHTHFTYPCKHYITPVSDLSRAGNCKYNTQDKQYLSWWWLRVFIWVCFHVALDLSFSKRTSGYFFSPHILKNTECGINSSNDLSFWKSIKLHKNHTVQAEENCMLFHSARKSIDFSITYISVSILSQMFLIKIFNKYKIGKSCYRINVAELLNKNVCYIERRILWFQSVFICIEIFWWLLMEYFCILANQSTVDWFCKDILISLITLISYLFLVNYTFKLNYLFTFHFIFVAYRINNWDFREITICFIACFQLIDKI